MSERWTALLQDEGAIFENGRVVGFTNHARAQAQHGLCDLSHYGVIKVSGDDATTFLQAQLTNDITKLDDGHAQWNGWCSPKGRLLVVFLIVREDANFLLLLPKSLQSAIQKRLGMFVLRAKVKIEDVSATLQRLGLVWINAAPTNIIENMPQTPMTSQLSGLGRIVRISDRRALILGDTETLHQTWSQLKTNFPLTGAASWDLAAIGEGVIEITPETQDAYVPQMANFELIGGVNFKKGCYPGQEIVARTQYRGILKRRMVRASFGASSAPTPNTAIYSPAFGDQAAGTIALAVTHDGIVEALIVAQIEAISSDSLFVDAAFTQKIRILDLPYAVL
jgi:tRNA-modifying protein YgfZ